MKIKYQEFNFRPGALGLIKTANEIIAEYRAQGFDLTLRQLYYQFVSRAIIPNTLKSYKNLGSVVNDARLAGLIDWNAIVDRTRELRTLSHWDDPAEIVAAVSKQFHIDLWASQKFRPEVWIEKDALVGVFERICKELDVPLFSCRGYTSQSEMWAAGQRLLEYRRTPYFSTGLAKASSKYPTPVIFHFGDHDPSGKDMSRDIVDRLQLFTGKALKFERLALNMDQVEEYAPPPNPAKITDSRANAYIAEFGSESWELDALEPSVLADLVRTAIAGVTDEDKMQEAIEEQDRHRETLGLVSDRFEDVEKFVREDM